MTGDKTEGSVFIVEGDGNTSLISNNVEGSCRLLFLLHSVDFVRKPLGNEQGKFYIPKGDVYKIRESNKEESKES